MKIAIVAATGATGRKVVDRALEAGHEVVAVARTPEKITQGVEKVRVDLSDPDMESLGGAFSGVDAVVSALGATSKDQARARIAARGTRAIVDAMGEAEVKRLVVLSAAPLLTIPTKRRPEPPKHDPGHGFGMRIGVRIVKGILREHYADLAEMEGVVADSSLEWTVVRPPNLVGKPPRGEYRTGYGSSPQNGSSICREDLARFMIDVIDDKRAVREAPIAAW
ncbi:NAD(P)-dependent oxidoreductase [Salininema proteolyticum]|uniref:NAD(P)-dependent oxidoreductase n=1 Tax=Salininema proteolyticum TaxID=1607685 RepID=A0ABV8TVP0_9ACTN